jgi:antitoxin component YwqK of YwqJK toxin-antitoxin module
MMRNFALLFLVLAFFHNSAWAQDERSEAESILSIDGPVTIELDGEDAEEEEYDIPEKKRKKNVFYGLKTKKRFTKSGYGNRVVLELFHVLKDFQLPETLVRDIYWFDYNRNEIRVGGNINEDNGAILHGPYTKEKNGVVIEEGIFYMGLKHGRWLKKNENNILLDKAKYYKGWPKESLVKYYDRDREQMQEIIPIEYGEKEGNYFFFHKNGKVAVRGEYKWDERIGEWYEFYPTGQRKKLIRYSKEPFNDDQKPFIMREWNPKGQVVYENKNN